MSEVVVVAQNVASTSSSIRSSTLHVNLGQVTKSEGYECRPAETPSLGDKGSQ